MKGFSDSGSVLTFTRNRRPELSHSCSTCPSQDTPHKPNDQGCPWRGNVGVNGAKGGENPASDYDIDDDAERLGGTQVRPK